MHYHGGRFKVKKNPRTVNGSEQPALPWGAYSFYMESIIFKNTSYINRVTGSIQWDERKLKIYMSKIFCCCFFQSPSCLTLHNPLDCSMPGLPAPHHFLELSQVHVHWICDVIQLSYPVTLFFPSISIFSNESAVCIRCSKYWNFSISPSKEHSVLISFKINWFDLLAFQGMFKSKTENIKLD